MKPHILIVEDEPAMRMGLEDNLKFEGYDVTLAENGDQGWDFLQQNSYDLVLLDIMMPGKSGYDVCRLMRAAQMMTPVIMLSARGEEIDKVLGLELGADDYLTKPFGVRELMARVKAMLRRSQRDQPAQSDPDILTLGRLSVNFKTYVAQQEGQPVRMSHKEFDVLQYLWQHKDEVVSRGNLLEAVWGLDGSITTRTVDNFILKLRQKMETDPAHPRYILTVHGLGYKLLSEV
ncbi:MAG: response regulator transcription factor [Bacteroidota bacterium]